MKTSLKISLRLLATLLCLALMIVSLPQALLSQAGEILGGDEPEPNAPEETENAAFVLGEMTDNRAAHTKTFRLSDGSYALADYAEAVHFEENGQWADYDNTLKYIETESFSGYENTASDVQMRFSVYPDDNELVSLQSGAYMVHMSLPGASPDAKAIVTNTPAPPEGNSIDSSATLPNYSSSLVYEEIAKDTDLQYILSGGSLKENILIRNRLDSYSYSFRLSLSGLTPSIEEDGSIILNDALSNEAVFRIPAGFMTDADGAFSSNVRYSLEQTGESQYILSILPDPEWLNAEDRKYPVTVDPSFFAARTGSDTLDNHVSEQYPNTNYYIDTHLVGGNKNGYKNEILFMAKTLSPLPPSATVIKATCMFRVNNTYAGTRTDGIKAVLLAYPILSEWDTLTVTWNSKPTVSTEALDFETFYSAGSATYIYYDITRLAQQWYSGGNNYGFALKVSGTTDGYVQLYSSDRSGSGYKPKLTIEYRDTKGLDDRWTFASQSAGGAGTGYVNGFNGNLVFVHNDKTTKGSILPVTVSHVFNAANADDEFNTSMPVGKGWKLSIQETVTLEPIGTETWYKYNDGDGTDLYFMEQSSSVYVSEDGLGLTLTFGSNDKRYCLTDDYGNKKYFNVSGNLSSVEDVNGNKKTFVYTNGKLTSVTYTPAGSSTPVTQLTFAYYTNGALQTITDGSDSSDYVTFKYSSTYNGPYSTSATSGYLRSITYSKGGGATIGYNSAGMITYVKNNSTERALVYAYDTHTYPATDQNTQITVHRVSRVTENGFDSDIIDWPTGQTARFSYGDKSFEVRTSGTNDTIDNSDDLLTTYLFDHEGKEICSYTSDV
ncbi:MAG: DNRLRE domain-containing protein, partial [Clostridia bacterium]|nr:DNRLRE domain-containing protein [Clostridia bacterium]